MSRNPTPMLRTSVRRLEAVATCLLGLVLVLAITTGALSAWAQAGGSRWVQLATRDVVLQSGQASFDVRRAKGVFAAVRIAARSTPFVLTRIEVRYSDGDVYREDRALRLQAGERTGPVGRRDRDRFVDRVTVWFRAADAEAEKAGVVIEGLQSAAGASAVRQEAPPIASSKPQASPTPPPIAAEQEKKQEHEHAAEVHPSQPMPPTQPAPQASPASPPPSDPAEQHAAPPVATAPSPGPTASDKPYAPAPAPAPPGGGAASGDLRGKANTDPATLWDVVPVFYGTDRVRDDRDGRATYTSERAKRLSLGRALVTVPKRHEVPTIERPWIYRLPFTQIVLYREPEDPRQHFTLKEVRAMTEDELIADVRERLQRSKLYRNHALVFVHGFNNSFDGALFRTAQIAYDLKCDGAPFLYSWPSKGALGISDYPYDRESSEQAEPFLRQFLTMVARQTGATSITVIAHSMGNQLLLPVLRDLERSSPPGVNIAQVIMAAPDVDRDAFENLARELSGAAGMTLLAASNDLALDISRRFWGGVPRAGDVPTKGPVVVDGVDTIDVTALSTDVFSLNHSGYAEKSALLADIRLLMLTGERPPDKRVPALRRVVGERGAYWRYP